MFKSFIGSVSFQYGTFFALVRLSVYAWERRTLVRHVFKSFIGSVSFQYGTFQYGTFFALVRLPVNAWERWTLVWHVFYFFRENPVPCQFFL